MKICLINPCNTYELVGNDPVIIKDQQGVYPPLGLLYTSAYINQKGQHHVDVIDCQAENITHAECAERVKQLNPDLIGMTAMTFTLIDCKLTIQELRKRLPNTPIVVGGPHTAIYPEETLLPSSLGADYVVVGEGEITLNQLACDLEIGKPKNRIYRQLQFIDKLDELPFADYDAVDINRYYSVLAEETPSVTLFTSRGCPFCLTGDTIINTIDGDIPIKDLVGREKVGVYTYDPKTKDMFIADAINIRMIWKNKQIVRVHFDDGTHIDCTPEHKFLTFKNGNQFVETIETPTEAKDLKIGVSVRAFREEISGGDGHINITWARRSRQKKARMMMEYKLGRKLLRSEIVHHKNHNKLDDSLENLEYCENKKVHTAHHPEVSLRMKLNNPSKSHLKSVRQKIRIATIGNKRSELTKFRLSQSKIGSKNPRYNPMLHVNHKVTRVTYLEYKQDVYCMEVPSTHWFFANKVLVANSCSYCDRPALGKGFRPQGAKRVIDEMESLQKRGAKEIFFYDDTFSVSMKRVNEICDEYIRRKLTIKWDIRTRVNVVNEELLKKMKLAGCERIHFGVESGNPRIVRTMNKGVSIQQVEQAFDICHRIGIKTLAYFMMGNPGETLDDVKDTLALSKRIKPDFMQMTILSPFPATKYYLDALRDGVLDRDVWKDYAININDDFRPPLWSQPGGIYSRQELESHLRWFYGKFYLHPKFILDRVMEIRNMGQFKRYASAGIGLLKMSLVPESKLKDSWGLRKRTGVAASSQPEAAVAVN